jgi:hypothetical protein
MDSKDWALHAVARRQAGVVSFAQARAVGFARDAMTWRLRRREWRKVLPGVVRLFWAEDSWETRCRAAALWAGKTGALSHLTAARLHGLDVGPQRVVHVTVHQHGGRLSVSGFESHRSVSVPSTVSECGLRVTTPARTMVDVASMVDEVELERLMGLALRHGQLRLDELSVELARAKRRTAGKRRLRGVIKRLVRAGAS